MVTGVGMDISDSGPEGGSSCRAKLGISDCGCDGVAYCILPLGGSGGRVSEHSVPLKR
jgi:hypothetical protein